MRMVEALPNALAAADPVSYLMTVGANAMRWHCVYHDPLVTRKRDQPVTSAHPSTVSLEVERVAEPEAPQEAPELQIVYDALSQLSKCHQVVLAAKYGLYGETVRDNEDIAAMLNLPKQTVETYLWRAKRSLARKLGAYVTEKGFGGGVS